MSRASLPHRVRRLAAPAAVVLALSLAAAACGDTTAPSASGAASPGKSASTSGTAVVIDTFMFGPSLIKIHIGDTVTWTNKDAIHHTVTSGRREYAPGNGGQVTATNKDGMFDLELDGRGTTAQFTFPKAGSFHYFCDRHPGMEADVEVS